MSQPLATTPSVKDVTESRIFPPGDIYSDETPLESDLHREQIDLLIRLIKWQLGLYLAVYMGKLRFLTPERQLVMLPEEESNQQLQQANKQLQQANQQLEQERQRAAILAERLRSAGIDPEQIF
ncbi:hypothetical protein [Nostoc sp.]|uniref:hypothetical protein n=1 Tax=Nostoc sp. TaxID=1180 RepID=UPI002FF5F92C